ncbi:MAG: hypothetical protein JJU31_15255 [Wenzhouxiangella sp.]|nr:hypothetical protein [Wenzhouxiangella sp.]
MSRSLEVIICTEAGPLEAMSMLLVASIRRLATPFSKVAISSYAPRPGREVSRETRKFFESHNVDHIEKALNLEFAEYPLANKPLACAYHEQNSQADQLLFLDSDTMFLRSPDESVFKGSFDARLNPVDYRNIGTNPDFSEGDPEYWRSVYELLGVEGRRTVSCTLERATILEYYNSGMVLVDRNQGIFSRWLDNFRRVWSADIVPSQGNFFIEQSVLSATLSQMEADVHMLGKDCNYPVAGYANRWRGWYPFSLKNVTHMHYHKLFHGRDSNPLKNRIARTAGGQAMNELIDRHLVGRLTS